MNLDDSATVAILGKATLRRHGVNTLTRAIHNQHGLAWTDGQSVYLAPLSLLSNPVDGIASVKLGEFEGVQSLQWSCDISPSTCFLCVVLRNTVSLWKVNWSSSSGQLDFKQVRKINASPIPQGCLWNPKNDVLCVLGAEQCSFYFKHTQNRGSFAMPVIDSGQIRCGCWTPDGTKLIIGIDSVLLIYEWHDIDSLISDYTLRAWKIPNVDGVISNMACVSCSRLLLSVEMPLDKLCTSQTDMFSFPDLDETPLHEETDIIKPSPRPSVLESLMNLHTNTEAAISNSSFLLQVALPALTVVTSHSLCGILKPDLIYSHTESSSIVVGSSCSAVLHTYHTVDDKLIYLKEVKLSEDERPKGISSLPSSSPDRPTFLIMAATRKTEDNTFPSSSNQSEYKLKLKCFRLEMKELLKNRVTDADSDENMNNHTASRCQEKAQLFDRFSLSEEEELFSVAEESPGTDLAKNSDNLTEKHLQNNSEAEILTVTSGDEYSIDSEAVEDTGFSCRDCGKSYHCTRQSCSCLPADSENSLTEQKSHLLNGSLGGENLLDSGIILTSGEDSGDSNSNSDGDEQIELTNLLLPSTSENFLQMRVVLGESDCDEAAENKELQVHTVNFSEQQPYFKNDVLEEMEKSAESCTVSTSEAEKPTSVMHTDTISLLKDRLGSIESCPVSVVQRLNERLKCLQSKSEDNVDNGEDDPETPAKCDRSDSDVEQMMDCEKVTSDCVDLVENRTVQREHLHDQSSIIEADDDMLMEDLDKDIQSQANQIKILQEKMASLSKALSESCCVSSDHYQSADKPDLIQLVYQPPDGTEISKPFLLDRGRLQLEPVKQTFDLMTLEIILDGLPCVVGANVDGYIPIRFSAGSTIFIQGKAQTVKKDGTT